MKTLYLFSKTPNHENIKLVKKLIDTSDCIVFIQNGVYIAKHNIEFICPIYILQEDAEARGIKIDSNTVEYFKLIDLIMEFDKVVTI
ncbi:MAG: sulfurtransferase complex subunit TusB [bacterium]